MIEADQIAALYDRHARGLAFYASQWTELADDCVQEAFCELARQKQPPHHAAAWLFRVVRNRALNSNRGESRRRRRERLSAKLERAPTEGPTSLDRVLVAEALDLLDDELREVIFLRIWSNLTLSEIAEMLGSSTATIHRRYHTALEQLKTHFELPCVTKKNSQPNS